MKLLSQVLGGAIAPIAPLDPTLLWFETNKYIMFIINKHPPVLKYNTNFLEI